MSEPRLQPLTRARIASLGEPGRLWVERLPALLADLEERWDLRIGRPLPGGSASYVARAVTRGPTPEQRVVKVGLPEDPTDPMAHLSGEAATLAAAHGRGYALLHDHDPAAGALLMEALGPSAEQTPAPVESTLTRLADTLVEAWTVQTDVGVPAPGEDKASSLHALVVDHLDRLGEVCSRAVVDRALGFAETLAAAYDPAECVVVHGDPHPANALRVDTPRPGADSGWVFVDPDGFRADPAYDLGVLVRDWGARLSAADDPRGLLEGWCRLLADRTGLDEQRIWAWGYLERVSTGLYVMGFGATGMGRWFLDRAELLV